MSFQQFEESVEDGVAIELYEFTYQGATTRYTSADRSIEILGVPYTAAILTRSDIEDSGKNVASASMTITARPDFPPGQVFAVYPPSDVVNIYIKKVHLADLSDARIIWGGRVINVGWPEDSMKLTCQSLYTRLKQPGLRRLYGRSCPHMLYSQSDGECKVDPLTFKEIITIDSVDGLNLTATAFGTFADRYFRGGKIEIEVSPGVFERRGIQDHVGDTITVTHPLSQLVAGVVVDTYPGCDKLQSTCVAKFNNVINFGGFPYVPQKNPYGNNSVF